jgi:hypothetical protein
MTETTKDGGPAFPVVDAPGCPQDYLGMSLRDYFAAHALQGLLAAEAHPRAGGFPCVIAGSTQAQAATLATNAYVLADAMLKARSDASL